MFRQSASMTCLALASLSPTFAADLSHSPRLAGGSSMLCKAEPGTSAGLYEGRSLLCKAGPGTSAGLCDPSDGGGKVEMIKAAYLGVSTSPLPAALAAQLKLPVGFGLVVDAVEKDSPSAAALKPHDVLIRLGDQKLVNASQLRAVVRSHKAGDEVQLTIIREGKEQDVKVKLVEKEVPAHEPVMPLPGETLLPGPRGALPFQQGAGAMSYADGEHQLEISIDKDGQRTLIAKDKAGKVIFEGPITGEEDRKKVPAELRAKLEKLEKSTKARFGGGAGRLNLDDLDMNFDDLFGQPLQGLPEGADRQEIEKHIKAMQEKMRQRVKAMQEQIEKQRAAFEADGFPGVPGVPPLPALPAGPGGQAFQQQSTVSVASFSDGEHTLTVRTDEKGKTLTAKDKDGKEVFNGPINTPEERAAIPEDIALKLKSFENFKIKGGVFRGGRAQDQPPAPPRVEREEDRQN